MDSPRSSLAGWSEISAPNNNAALSGGHPSAHSAPSALAGPAAAAAALGGGPLPAAAASSTSTSAAAAAAPSAGSVSTGAAAPSPTSMTVIRALDEVSLLDKRISKKTSEAAFLGVLSKKASGVANPDEFGRLAKADWQSLKDLIARRNRLKCALLRSNATTVVRVGGEALSVAEVIERRKALSLHRDLLARLKSQREATLRQVNQLNTAADAELQKLLEVHFGKSGSQRTNAADIEDISRPFREANQARTLDPIGVDARIRELEAYVEMFDREAKFTLSESNAITRIEV